jgi:hypothetical protein
LELGCAGFDKLSMSCFFMPSPMQRAALLILSLSKDEPVEG